MRHRRIAVRWFLVTVAVLALGSPVAMAVDSAPFWDLLQVALAFPSIWCAMSYAAYQTWQQVITDDHS